MAGCINLIQGINSWYWWQGKVENSSETLLLIKTSHLLLHKLASLLKKHHAYEVPELIALPIQWGDRPYLGWLGQNLCKPIPEQKGRRKRNQRRKLLTNSS